MPIVGTLALVAAYAGFAVLSVVLTVIDLRAHRLPHGLVLPAYPIAAVLLAVAAIAAGDGDAFLRAVVGMAALFAFYLALRLAQPGGMGGGDVTLSGLIGLLLSYLGWDPLLIGALAGFVAGGLFSLAVILLRRADRRTRIPFGPWMLLGAWIGIAFHVLLV